MHRIAGFRRLPVCEWAGLQHCIGSLCSGSRFTPTGAARLFTDCPAPDGDLSSPTSAYVLGSSTPMS